MTTQAKRPRLSRADLERAIAIIEDCRRTHVEWAEWQQETPDWRDKVLPDSPGGPEHHHAWVAKYDHVLAVLRKAAQR